MLWNSTISHIKKTTVIVRNTNRINPISIFAKLFPTQWQTPHLVFGPLWHLRNTHRTAKPQNFKKQEHK